MATRLYAHYYFYFSLFLSLACYNPHSNHLSSSLLPLSTLPTTIIIITSTTTTTTTITTTTT